MDIDAMTIVTALIILMLIVVVVVLYIKIAEADKESLTRTTKSTDRILEDQWSPEIAEQAVEDMTDWEFMKDSTKDKEE